MNLALYIYLCDVVPTFGALCIFFAILLIVFVVVGVLFVSEFNKVHKGLVLSIKIAAGLSPVLMLCGVCAPSKNTMYAMGAVYYAEQAVKSETFQRLNGKALQLLEVKIDELLEKKK